MLETLQAREGDVPPLVELQEALDLGQALGLQPWLGAMAHAAEPAFRLAAARALRQLGDDRAGDALALRTGRAFAPDHEARLGLLRTTLANRGPYGYWRLRERGLLPPDQHESERAARLSLDSLWLAQLRDDSAAMACGREALSLVDSDPWLWVEHSYALVRMDRMHEGLAAARQALALKPGYRTALLHVARVLHQLRRADEARALLEQAWKATGGGWYGWQLFTLAEDEQRHADAWALLEALTQAFPLADRGWRAVLAARRADTLLSLGRLPEAREMASQVPGTGFYARLEARLRDPGVLAVGSRTRAILPLAMVQQLWMTCAPATLTALAGYWGRAADHVEVAQAICYDGTPQASERNWAASQGFHVREFWLDWETAGRLIDAGVPFALATQHVGGGHLQAVVGIDRIRGTLLVRDPSQPTHAEFDADALFATHKAVGPRALLMLPQAEHHRLQGIDLPQAEACDHAHEVLAGLQRHDREAALQALLLLRDRFPGGDLTWRSERNLALYDGDEPRILAATEVLLERFPDDHVLQLSRLTSLFEVRGQQAGEAYLSELVARPQPDALLLTRWAHRLAQDSSRLDQADHVIRRALRRDGGCGRAWSQLSDQLWARHGVAPAVAPARWASTLMPTEEWAATQYARATRLVGRPDEGLAWLALRDQTWGDRSGQPAITWAEELGQLQRDAEAESVLAAALRRRPGDAALRLFLAERALGGQRLEEADNHLAAATDAAAPAKLRLRALLLEERNDLTAALEAARAAIALEPLQLSHHRLLLRLLRRLYGDVQALAMWRPLPDAHPSHFGLQKLLYDALPDQPEPINAQLDRLQEQHPGVVWLQRERAVQASRQNRHDEAVALAQAALQLAPESPASHDVLAYCLLRRDGPAAALPHLERALRRDAEYEPAWLRLLDISDATNLRAHVDLLAAEMQRQVLLGDGLLQFQAEAHRAWSAEEILTLLDSLRQRWPALWQGPVAQAQQLSRMGRIDDALDIFAAAAERFPTLPRVHVERADALRLAGRLDEARSSCATALTLSPSWNRAVRLQLDLLCKYGSDWDAGERLLQRALSTRDGWCDADLIGLLAWVHEGQRRDEDARAAAQRSLLIDPRPDWIWALVMRVSERAEAPALFDSVVDAVVTHRPGDAAAWLVRAEHARDDAEGLAAAVLAIELQPRLEAAWLARLRRLALLGRIDEAQSWLSRLPWPSPAPLSLRAWAPRLAWARDEQTQAISQLRRLREEAPYDEALCVRLADWLDERNDNVGYLEVARELVTLAPLESRSHGYLGHALVKCDRFSEALEPLLRAVELSPSYTFAVRQLVRAAREAGKPESVQAALQTLWPFHRDVPLACDGLEMAALAGLRAEAEAWLERLLPLEDFDIDHCRRAVAALRQAGWGAWLHSRVEAHLASGGGPVGLGLDWLEQGTMKQGVLRTAWGASGMLRGATRPHLAVALLRWLGDREAKLMLGIMLRRHEAHLRQHAINWGEVSFALSRMNLHAATVRWLADWRQQARPPHFAMANLAGSLAVLKRWAELEAVVQSTLERFPYLNDMRLWQLLLLARRGDLEGLAAALDRTHEWTTDPWMRLPLQSARHFAALASSRAGGATVSEFRRAMVEGGADQGVAFCRELRRLARWRHTPWTRLHRWL